MSISMRIDDLIYQCKNCEDRKDIILQIEYLGKTRTDTRRVYMNGEYYVADGIMYFEVAEDIRNSEKEKINNQDFIKIIEQECELDPKCWGSLYRSPMDMIGDLEIRFVDDLTEYESEDYSIIDYDENEQNIVITLRQIAGADEYNMEDIIKENLRNIQEKNEDYNYEIYADMSEFSDIVWLGETYKERLQILVMLYYVKPTLKELRKLDIEQVFNYIKNTDEYWEKDKKYFEKCMYIITEKLL